MSIDFDVLKEGEDLYDILLTLREGTLNPNIAKSISTLMGGPTSQTTIGLCVVNLYLCKELMQTNKKLEALRKAHNVFVSREDEVG